VGVHQVTLKVAGISGLAETTVKIRVDEGSVDNPPIAVAQAADPDAVEGDVFVFTDSNNDGQHAVELDGSGSYDPDGDAISGYQWYLNSNLIGSQAVISHTFAVGSHTVTLKVTNASGQAETTVNIRVDEGGGNNTAPVLNPVDDQAIQVGEKIILQLSATDADEDTLIFSSNNLPINSALDPGTGLFQWRPWYDQSGQHTITFSVSDGIENVSQDMQIDVSQKEVTSWYQQWLVKNDLLLNVSTTNKLLAIGDKTGRENKEIEFQVQAIGQGDFMYYAENLPEGAFLDSQTGQFSWRPWYDQTGQYTVLFIVTLNDWQAQETIDITVDEVELSDWYAHWFTYLTEN
jgi:hypothetical protein